nr:hypothetical protein [Tanacetum cinerariifolium]
LLPTWFCIFAMGKFKEALKDFQQKLCREALRMLLGTYFGGQTFRHSWGHSPATSASGRAKLVEWWILWLWTRI